MSETLLFVFSLIASGATIFLFVYFIITLSDLECDYLNSQQCCSKLNMWVIPKLASHAFLTLQFILLSHWLLAALNIPLAAWFFYEYYTVPRGNMGVYDPTEIHNRGQLKKHMRNCMIILGYYLLSFFIYLYCLIIALLKGNPLERADPEVVMRRLTGSKISLIAPLRSLTYTVALLVLFIT